MKGAARGAGRAEAVGGGVAVFESAVRVVVLGTGAAGAGGQVAWVVVCMESGVAVVALFAVGAAGGVWAAGEVEAAFGSWTGLVVEAALTAASGAEIVV